MKKYIIIIFALALLSACQKEFQVDNSKYEPKLVVNNLFQQNTPFEVRVSHSVNVYDTINPEYVSTAVVKLYINGQYTETLSPFGNGYYSAVSIPEPSKTYRLQVSNTGFKDAEAENTLPNPVQISDWYYIDSTYQDANGDYYGELSLTINDPAEENNYLLSLEFYDVVTASYLNLGTFSSDDQSLNQNLAKRLDNGEYLFTDNLFNGKKKVILLKVPSGFYQTQPNYLLKLFSLSKDAYFYAYTKPTGGLNGFNNSPVYTNVKNGLGIFAGRSLFVDTIR